MASVHCLETILRNIAEELHCLVQEWLFVTSKLLHFLLLRVYFMKPCQVYVVTVL